MNLPCHTVTATPDKTWAKRCGLFVQQSWSCSYLPFHTGKKCLYKAGKLNEEYKLSFNLGNAID